MLQQARDAVPQDVSATPSSPQLELPGSTLPQVADWTAEGGELAAGYLGAGAGYLGAYLEPEYLEPRLDQLLATLARCLVCSIQHPCPRLRAQLGAAGSGAADAAVPALQAVARELEDTVLLARCVQVSVVVVVTWWPRETVAPVVAGVGEGWEDVREHPVARKVGS